MSQEKLITVVTVTWNCVDTVAYTLRSVAAVKGPAVEYVVVDGASTDGTLELLQQAGSLIDKLVSEPDAGIYNAMNKAVSIATGRFVIFINGDDELLLEGFAATLPVLAQTRNGIVSATTLVGSKEHPDETLISEPWKLLFHNSVPHPSTFAGLDLLRRFPFREDLRIAADYDFFLCCYLAGERFARVEVPAALHHRGGASANAPVSAAELESVRRERLGWRLPWLNVVSNTYRALRKLYPR